MKLGLFLRLLDSVLKTLQRRIVLFTPADVRPIPGCNELHGVKNNL